jgi:hypothetical protein
MPDLPELQPIDHASTEDMLLNTSLIDLAFSPFATAFATISQSGATSSSVSIELVLPSRSLAGAPAHM